MEQVGIARGELRSMPAVTGADGRRVVAMRDFAQRMALPAASLKRLVQTMESTGEVVLVVEDGDEEIHFAG